MAMEYHFARKIQPLKNIRVLSLTDIELAMKMLSPNKEYTATVALSYEDTSISLPVLQTREPKPFDQSATYLLVNSLNITGAALSRWMVTQGARNLVYLEAQGEEAGAKGMLAELQSLGAQTTVITADVTESKDVQRAVEGCGSSLRGIIYGSTTAEVRKP
jgi:hypothetical protein